MKKIAILGLHLNYGGVEQSIINQANALSERYEVELAITYKMVNTPAFAINSKVKIKYLTNCVPNREEFKNYLHNKKFYKAFKSGLKSIKILYQKYSTMKKYIMSSNADIIISSRVDITKILNKYVSKNKSSKPITITEEHRHHNNDMKYIKKLKKACKNIDYLVSVSSELNDFYTKEIPNIKCLYIPNSLNYWPNKVSKLNNKNLISIGRLSREKGFADLIDVFKILHDKDSEFHLDIIGDGNEFNNLKVKIQDLNLKDNVKIHGFQNREYINKCLLNSSLYLMCSHEESFGIVLIEAGSFGIPQIAFSTAQGAKEIIDNNKSGYLIDNRDKNLMAEKVLNLISNKELLQEFSKNSRNIAKNYTFNTIKMRWLKLIENILKAKK